MIAFSIFSLTAAAVYPIFFNAKKESKFGDSRELCQNIVRGKLEEYRLGHVTDINSAATVTGDYAGLGLPANPQLLQLTVPTLSDTTTSELNSGNSGTLVSGGFLYAKIRYNRFFPYSCSGQSQAAIWPVAAQPILGMRECVGSNAAWLDIPSSSGVGFDCSTKSAQDVRINSLLPGFKLYVKLELSTPWLISPSGAGSITSIGSGSAAQNSQFSNQCPDMGSWTSASHVSQGPLYDFDGAGDGIRVTVTGVIDTLSQSAGIKQIGGISDPNRLSCSASAVINPPSDAARFYLSADGRIYSIHGNGQNGNASGGWMLPSIYTQTGGSMNSGIISFAVHPRNLSVYVLRRGSLIRYGSCGGIPLDCDGNQNNTGLSDGIAANPTTGNWPSVQEFPVLPSLASIAVDFRSGTVYGLTGDKNDVVTINFNNQPLALCQGPCSQTAAAPPVLAFATINNGFPKPFPNAQRLSGFFINPEGDSAFVSDMASTNSLQGTTYSASIYKSLDANLTNPVSRLPLSAVSFSK